MVPPFVEGSSRSVAMGTPYVFKGSSRIVWESFFQRYLASGNGDAPQVAASEVRDRHARV